jgi:hypothetical protein
MIIGITELKPKNSRYSINPAEIAIKDFDLFHSNLDNNVGRGIALYTHKTLGAMPYYLETEYQESIWAEIKLNSSDRLLVGCVYRSGSGSEENNVNLEKLVKEAADSKHSHLLITGDFNYPDINWETWSSDKEEQNHFVETIRDCYLYQHIRKPTRGRINNEPSLLDLILSNEEGMITDIEYQSPIGKSDHCVLNFNFNCYTEVPKYKKTKYYYDRGDYAAAKEELQKIDWHKELENCNVQEQWTKFAKIMKDLENKCIPHKVIDMSAKRRGNVPMDLDSLKKIKKKHKLWKKYMETRDGKIYQEYCTARNQLRNLTRKLRRNFEKDLAKQVKKNPKALWKYIKSKSKTREGVSDLYMDPNDDSSPLTKTNEDKAKVLGDFFTSVFTNEPDGTIPELPRVNITEAMEELIITREMVTKILRKLKIEKSPGPDGLHPRFLKELADQLSYPITIIYQTSMRDMELPEEWKQGKISAIFKKGNRKSAKNYRPVSLTSIVCKSLEHIVREHIMKYMAKNKLFSENQYGFMPGRSTTLQLLHVIDKWTEALDEGYHVDTVYMDFMKAFDTVPHRRLIGKLASYGINNPILGWVEAFLSNRVQQVQVNGATSEWMSVTSGIPQGSVLGPVLFIIYINDLPDCVESYAFLFADDTKLFKVIRDENDSGVLQKDLESAITWSNTWLLRFHPDKCIAMTIGKPKGTPAEYKLDMNGKEYKLKPVEEEKDIGVVIDTQLNFETHISQKVNKANSIFGLIRRSYTNLDKVAFIPLYKSLVRSLLEYAN